MAEQPSLQALLNSHAKALETDKQAWEISADVYDRPEIQALPLERVKVGADYLRMEDGQAVSNPIYLWSVKSIREHYGRHLDAQLGFLREDDAARRNALRERIDATIKEKVSELNAIKDANNKVKEDCLYFDALETAQESSRVVKAIEEKILQYSPKTLAEVSQQAGWILASYQEGGGGYLEDSREALETFISTLSKADGVLA